MNSLIKAEIGEWDTPEIQCLFLPHEAAIIYGIPLSTKLPSDRIIWGLTPSGTFTTKSAYKLLVSYASTNLAGSSSSVQQRKFWRDLWLLRVPNKIKHFAWRVCNSSLPTMVNLQRRHISVLNTCEACETEHEDELHALWSCSKLAELSQLVPVSCRGTSVQLQGFIGALYANRR